MSTGSPLLVVFIVGSVIVAVLASRRLREIPPRACVLNAQLGLETPPPGTHL